MANPYTQPDMSLPGIANAEHIDPATTGDNIAAKKVAGYTWNGSTWERDVSNRRYAGGLTPYAKVLTGNDTITPSAGKALQVNWVAFVPDSDNTSANQVTVGFNGGSTLYIGYAIAHWEPFVGDADQVLNITLANAQPVSVMVQYKEV